MHNANKIIQENRKILDLQLDQFIKEWNFIHKHSVGFVRRYHNLIIVSDQQGHDLHIQRIINVFGHISYHINLIGSARLFETEKEAIDFCRNFEDC